MAGPLESQVFPTGGAFFEAFFERCMSDSVALHATDKQADGRESVRQVGRFRDHICAQATRTRARDISYTIAASIALANGIRCDISYE